MIRTPNRLSLRLFAVLFLLAGIARAQFAAVGDGGPGPVKAQHLTAELVSLAPAVSPGGTVQVGLVLALEEHWHVYWLNAGDSGEPPKIVWTLPAGVTAGPMQFAAPSRLPLGPLMDFGYEETAAFPLTISVAPDVKPGKVHLDAKVSWLVCAQVCIPGKAHLGLDLDVQPNAPAGQAAGALGTAISLIPKPMTPAMKFSVVGGKTDLVLTLLTGHDETDAEFYPIDPDIIANAAPQMGEGIKDGVRIRVKRAPELTALPATLHGVVKFSDTLSYEVNGPVTAGEVAPSAGMSISSSKPGAPAGADGVTWIGAIGLAFVGGIILNLMPCVFPVLFLKGLALVQSSGEERGRMRSHGLVYTLGILVSFWVIVGVLLGLRAGGSQAGWGFQLQSPVFIAVLASGLFFFALSLAGQFDMGLSMTSVGGELAKKEGFAGSFFTGVLATIVATPCTAPLMGAAIGFALAQPPGVTFAVFTALGLGLALPYLLLTLQPAWTRILPRPGAWMETLKQATAVPLFGTVIWLAWVYGQLFAGESGESVNHLAMLLTCFLLLAIAGWVMGRWPGKWSSAIVAGVLILVGLAIPLSQRADAGPSATKAGSSASKDGLLTWAPYSQAAVDAARKDGHPVFIDFTAAWCLSCQVNERLVLKSDEVQKDLRDRKVTLLKADWTKYDETITQALAAVGRSGVPTYVIYPAGSGAPDVLPEVLTKAIVLDAIKKDAGK
ncbi:protein-disulfide reductase DsbD family protein [Granulicella rosea]|nr:thioredoxin family protein [Granulicella rosea]